MSRPILPPTDDELKALYRETASEEPGPQLDQFILAAAQADLKQQNTARSKHIKRPWWKSWLAPTSAIAATVLGISLSWQMMDQQERDFQAEMASPEPAKSLADKAEVSSPVSAPTSVPITEQSAPAEAQAAAESPRRKEKQLAPPPPRAEPRDFPAQPSINQNATAKSDSSAQPAENAPIAAGAAPAKPLAAMPAPAPLMLKKSQPAENDNLQEMRASAEPMQREAEVARESKPQGKLEAKKESADFGNNLSADSHAAAARPSLSSTDPATPEAWLKSIRELRDTGHAVEAAQSLARFHTRHPDFVLPDDLKPLLKVSAPPQ